MIPVLHGVWAAAAGPVSDFELIETQTVGAGGSASVTFSSIPQTYKHLQIRGIHRTSRNATADNIFIQVNGDTATTYYALHSLEGNGTSASSSGFGFGTAYNNGLWANYGPAATATANVFGAFVFDLLDYTSTTKNKTARSLCGFDANGSGFIHLKSSLWGQTSAVTSLTLLSQNAVNISQYSTFSLYGVK